MERDWGLLSGGRWRAVSSGEHHQAARYSHNTHHGASWGGECRRASQRSRGLRGALWDCEGKRYRALQGGAHCGMSQGEASWGRGASRASWGGSRDCCGVLRGGEHHGAMEVGIEES